VTENRRIAGGHFFDLVEEYRGLGCSKLFAGIILLIDLRDAYGLFCGEDCYTKHLLRWNFPDPLARKEELCFRSIQLNPEQLQQHSLQSLPGGRDEFFRDQFRMSLEFRKKLTSKPPPGDSLVSVVEELIRSIQSITFKVSKLPPDPQPHFVKYVEVCMKKLQDAIYAAKGIPSTGKSLAALLNEYRAIYGTPEPNSIGNSSESKNSLLNAELGQVMGSIATLTIQQNSETTH